MKVHGDIIVAKYAPATDKQGARYYVYGFGKLLSIQGYDFADQNPALTAVKRACDKKQYAYSHDLKEIGSIENMRIFSIM